ncbi:histidine phosphatase family protein [Stieleria sp. TO1_6]|uniref:histidine phosphatase family protein n=1 Tax=Stieleria tagensis TaxID=2956795 RepID=UPI00209BB8AD|nr:histidine phosphatase family protein [Stieleria tagensis]MCO8122198.1 histidine phosphatase family protein [Stieleria tagensis]
MSERICILLRHGDYHQLAHTPSAHQPFPLNANGQAQAEAGVESVRRLVQQQGWSIQPEVHSSILLRAWQTARIIVDGLPECERIIETDQLTERCVGSGANLTKQQIERVIDQDPRYASLPANWKSDSQFRLPFVGAESLLDAGRRVADYIERTMQRVSGDGQAVLFIGHGASFRHAAHCLGVLSLDRVSSLSMYHARPVALALSADGHWHHAGGDWKPRHAATQYTD